VKLRWRKAALAELDEAAAYIAQDNPRAAAQLVQRIAYAAEGLLTFPRMGRPIDDSGFYFVLTVPRTLYLMFYSLREGQVVITKVVHGQRRR